MSILESRLTGQSMKKAALAALAFEFCTLATLAHAASFDCAKAKAPDERAICASRQLSEMDVDMAVRFDMLTGLVPMGTRGHMQDEQLQFLSRRHACKSDARCLKTVYTNRIDALKGDYATLKSRGPF